MLHDELRRPLTEIEKAALMNAATKPDHQLSEAGVLLLRRALFQLDLSKDARLKERDLIAGYLETDLNLLWAAAAVREGAHAKGSD